MKQLTDMHVKLRISFREWLVKDLGEDSYCAVREFPLKQTPYADTNKVAVIINNKCAYIVQHKHSASGNPNYNPYLSRDEFEDNLFMEGHEFPDKEMYMGNRVVVSEFDTLQKESVITAVGHDLFRTMDTLGISKTQERFANLVSQSQYNSVVLNLPPSIIENLKKYADKQGVNCQSEQDYINLLEYMTEQFNPLKRDKSQ